jgi:LiaF transmembrane domain/B-box zinc finger
MNCATHSDAQAVAYCRTCGKPLCANCTRSVQGVIYCESCLAERLHGAQPPGTAPPAAGFVSSSSQPYTNQPYTQGTGPNAGPNPTVAGILAGLFPFGVGAVYTGQYAKGLAHLGIFVLLIIVQSSDVPWFMHVFFGLAIAFFIVYQIADAVRTARAVQTGQPAPDPFGLGQTFSPGQKVDTSKIPLGAVILIGLGVLFLLSNVMNFDIGDLWPLILIGLGLWLGATRLGLTGRAPASGCTSRTLMGPAVLITIGGLFLLERAHGPGFGRTWPILLLVIGLIKLLGTSHSGSVPPPIPPASGSGPIQGEVQPPSSEVHNG